MKLLKLLLPVLALCVMASAPSLRAEDGGQKKGKGGPSPEARVAQIDAAVTLTADQKTKITAILTKAQGDVMALPQEERGAKGGEIRQAANKEIRALLTDAQKAKFDAMPAPAAGKKKKD